MNRRQFIQIIGAGSLAFFVPISCNLPESSARFLPEPETVEELSTKIRREFPPPRDHETILQGKIEFPSYRLLWIDENFEKEAIRASWRTVFHGGEKLKKISACKRIAILVRRQPQIEDFMDWESGRMVHKITFRLAHIPVV